MLDKKLKDTLFLCLKESAQILRRGFGSKLKITKKGPINIVTEVDMASEKKIISIIKNRFPDHRILAEESSPKEGSSPFRWIIDPLDGTTNYAHHLNLFCTSIGVEYKGEMILGGIYNPIQNELYFAEKGKGATLNGRRIHVSKNTDLSECLLVTGFPYDTPKKAQFYLEYFRRFLQRAQGIRRLGSAALDLAYVANGTFDAFWEFNLKPWDMAAGILIVKEAGGQVTNFSGKILSIDTPQQLLASNRKIHPKLIQIFK